MIRNEREDELLRVIRGVRRRWRLRLALRGAVVVVGVAVLTLVLGAWGLERAGFDAGAIDGFRAVTWLIVAAAAAWFLGRPLLRRTTDERVALYLEEHEPALEARVVSALDVARRGGTSPALARRLLDGAIERCHAMDDGRFIERPALLRSSGWLAGGGAAAALVLLLGPDYLRHGAAALALPLRDAEAARPYAILVEPGDTTIATGADQRVVARLTGFGAEAADVMVRAADAASFQPLPMARGDGDGAFEAMLFDLGESVEYFVRAGTVRSPVHRIEVADLPHVRRLRLEYRFPAYTGLPDRVVEDGGDIAALRGTEVLLRVEPSMATAGGRVVVGRDTLSLEPADGGALAGRLRVSAPGSYRIELRAPTGQLVPASPEHIIDVLDDQPPSVRVTDPGRDTRATTIEEVFLEARADDDFGVARLDLVLAVNGGEPRAVPLFRAGAGPRREVTAGHTLFLEELELQPGDVIAYHARATDAAGGGGARQVASDIYFLQIRPFETDFRQAQQQPGGGGGGGEPETGLSEQQREIVAATFNVDRDRATYRGGAFDEHLATLALAQERLREQVGTLVRRLQNRGAVQLDSGFAAVLEALPAAAAAMEEAAARLREKAPEAALGPEQRALQHLLRAEAAFREVQVAQGQQGGGGGGGAAAEDLADLFELELDKLKNQYETLQRGREEQADQRLDETLEKLKELARRQQQEAERRRRSPAADGDAQRRLAEETEQEARRLERLAREQAQPELEEAARRMREAAEAMRRAAAEGGAAEAAAAQDRLDAARRRLERSGADRLERGARGALRQAEELLERQREVGEDVAEMEPQPGQRRQEQLRRIIERKDAMAADVAELERRLGELAADAGAERPDAARALREAAEQMRDARIEDKIRYSRGVAQQRTRDYADAFEEQIEGDLEATRDRVRAAAEASRGAGEREDGASEALDRARDLLRAAESFDERAGQAANEAGRAETGGEAAAPGGDARGRTGGRIAPDRARQFQREMGERREQAEALRGSLEAAGVDAQALDDVIRAMRALEDSAPYGDARALARLRAQIVEGLRRIEFDLRRGLDTGTERLHLRGSDDVPEGFRELVEEYYRSLSRDRSTNPEPAGAARR